MASSSLPTLSIDESGASVPLPRGLSTPVTTRRTTTGPLLSSPGAERWGRLLPLSGTTTTPIELVNPEVSIGRAEGCLVHVEDKRVSKVHCIVRWDQERKVALLEDRSTNGTLCDGVVVRGGEPVVLAGGAEIILVKPEPGKEKIGFVMVLTGIRPARTMEQEEDETVTQDLKRRKTEVVVDAAPAPAATTTTTTAAAALNNDPEERKAWETEMCCQVCDDFLYRPVSLLPCLHNLCSACWSRWADKATTCPMCRVEVTQLRKNHQLNNIVSAYLDANPGKKRSAEELAEMDAANKVTEDELKVTRKHYHHTFGFDAGDDDGYSDSDDYDEDEEDEPATCPECAQAGPDGYKCPAAPAPDAPPLLTPAHVMCSRCFQLLPNRTPNAVPPAPQTPYDNSKEDRPTRCAMCYGLFCNMYFGATRPCQQALRRVKDHTFAAVPPTALMGNAFERNVLQGVLNKRGITPQGVYASYMPNLDSLAAAGGITADHAVCTSCSTQIFNKIIYDYRAKVPKDQLPPEIAKRQDCWYGQACRTQTHKPEHAQNLNHICEQKRK
jgi:hypothetical protein